MLRARRFRRDRRIRRTPSLLPLSLRPAAAALVASLLVLSTAILSTTVVMAAAATNAAAVAVGARCAAALGGRSRAALAAKTKTSAAAFSSLRRHLTGSLPRRGTSAVQIPSSSVVPTAPTAPYCFRTFSSRSRSGPRGGGRSSRSASSLGGTSMSIEDTPLGSSNPAGRALLDGLDLYEVPADDDSHPLSVYGIHSSSTEGDDGNTDALDASRHPVLMLHGRTWSSVPVYHLLGGPHLNQTGELGETCESRSTMEALYDAGLQPYAVDFRGFGGTPKDWTGGVEPDRCVCDAETVLRWIARRHGLLDGKESGDGGRKPMPALLGWSQGALVAQLAAQRRSGPKLLSGLILYGSIYDPNVRYPRAPLYTEENGDDDTPQIINTFDAAIEDFTVEGTIPPEPARKFAEAALTADPIKATWTNLHQFNDCDPARVNVPTLVIAGDQDPYAPLRVQSELFANLGGNSPEADRTWSVISGADHAVHLLDGRDRFVRQVKNFVDECCCSAAGGGEAQKER